MNIILRLLQKFFFEESINTFLLILFSFLINIFQTNGLSFITAKIIFFIQKNNSDMVYNFFKLFVVISGIYIVLFNFYKYFQNKLLTKLRQWIKKQFINLILLLNNENFKEMNFSRLSSPINRISSVCFMVFTDVITYLLPNISFLLILFAYFLTKDIPLGLIFIMGNIILFGYLFFTWEKMREANENYEKDVGENESYLLEILSNIDKIIYRGQTKNEIEIFNEKSEKATNSAFEFYSTTNKNSIAMNIILHMIIFACIGYLIHLYFKKNVTLTSFITLYMIILLYRDKMIAIIQQIPDFIEFIGRSEAVLKYFKDLDDGYNSIDEIYDKKYEDVVLDFNTIRFHNISFRYNTSNVNVLTDFNLIMNLDNKIIGITGLSGNGKSTFAKMLLKMYKPLTGDIYIDEANIKDVDANYIRKNITYVNQNSKLFDKMVIENMFYGCSDANICQAHLNEIMKYDKIKMLYRNMDINSKTVGPLGENLSGGQRQIINVIGGLINPSKILILDEPTSALDSELKQELLDIILDFKKHKKCIIIISHDSDCYKLFDEVVKI